MTTAKRSSEAALQVLQVRPFEAFKGLSGSSKHGNGSCPGAKVFLHRCTWLNDLSCELESTNHCANDATELRLATFHRL